jgi:hypothetical protein
MIDMCEHLIELDNELKARGIKETFRGQPWSDNCREWVYYDCVLDLQKIRDRHRFPFCIEAHVNDDMRSGMEAGFVCDACKDAVIGVHPHFSQGRKIVE